MADYYVLRGAESGNTATVALHYNISALAWTNVAGKTLAECLTEDPTFRPGPSAVPWLDPATQALIDSIDIVEAVSTIEFTRDHLEQGNAGKQAAVESLWTSEQRRLLSRFQSVYWAWGYEGTV